MVVFKGRLLREVKHYYIVLHQQHSLISILIHSHQQTHQSNISFIINTLNAADQ